MSTSLSCKVCGKTVRSSVRRMPGDFVCKTCRKQQQSGRALIIVGIVLVALVVVGAAGVIGIPRLVPLLERATDNTIKVTRANFMKVRGGMSLQEVEAILGPGQEIPPEGVKLGKETFLPPRKNVARIWQYDRRTIFVYFRDNKVAGSLMARGSNDQFGGAWEEVISGPDGGSFKFGEDGRLD